MARGRPPLAIGTYGEISVSDGDAPYKARARYRDTDGQVRTVARFGQTKAAARAALRKALSERQHDAGELTRQTRVEALAKQWLDEIAASDRAERTKAHYGYVIDQYVTPKLGDVRIGEATTAAVDRTLKAIAKANGPAAARSVRAVLNGMFGLAVRHDALEVNPVRETQSIASPRRVVRALTVDEANDICDRLRSDPRAVDYDLPDLVEFALATGCRIGELLAIRESACDLEAGTVEINATVIRVAGKGLVIQERTKTASGWRVLALPPFAVDMLRRRAGELRFRSDAGVVFASPKARAIRDPSNTTSDLREVLDRIGRPDEPPADWVPPYGWVTFHTFRRTVATRLDEAGFSPRETADQLGHSQPSMTQDRYMGRRVVSARAAEVLDR